MATYRKRGKKWRVEICQDGKRLSKTFPTKGECEKWASIQTYQIMHGELHASAKKTFRDAMNRYLLEVVPQKGGAERETNFVKVMMNTPMADMLLENLSVSDFASWRDYRLTKVKGSTVNREFTIIKAMYKVAINEWQWCKQSPITDLTLPSDSPPRDRRVSEEEIEAILLAMDFTELREPVKIKEYVACAWLFALETAMRSSEILALTWDRVNLKERYVHVNKSKNGSKRDVALSTKAIEILNVLPRNNPTCFRIDARQRDANFRKYRDQAGIEGLTFHDSRHEALTRLAKKLQILDLAIAKTS